MLKKIFGYLNLKLILLTAFGLRLIALPWTFHADVTATYWWGIYATKYPWQGFYDWLNFSAHSRPDQPMLNIYYDWIIRQIYLICYKVIWFINVNVPLFPSKLMIWYSESGNQILLKLPMVLADIALIYFSYKFIHIYFSKKASKIVALILALYLPLIYNSAIWGSGDSIVNLFGLLSIYFVWQRKYTISLLLFLFSVLYKPSLLIWTPIIILISIKNKPKLNNIIITLVSSLIFIYLICFPFIPQGANPASWFVNVMQTRILPGYMPHLTANAMNLWGLIYGLTPKFDNLILLNTISARNLSFLICLPFYIFQLYKFYRNFNFKNLLLILVTFTLTTFSFMTRMHERYSYPALIPLFLLCFYDHRFLKYFVLLSITHTYNVLCAWWFPSLLNNYLLTALTGIINIYITLKLIFIKTPDNKWK